MKILVVDYPTPERRATVEALAALGHTDVIEVGEAWAALKLLAAGGVDLVITEYHLPVMTGIVFLQSLRRKDSTTPVLVVTNQALETTVAASLDAGANAYLRKPISPETLAEKLAPLLAGPGATR